MITRSTSGSSRPRISVAPMMDHTDRHCRYFHRLLSRRTMLYAEMISPGAILFGDRERFLRFDESEHPVAAQLGGSDAAQMAASAAIVTEFGYDEVNVNVGCPSDRVQSGKFGACLMKEPALVADCIRAMRDATDIPVTVKSRIGVDDHDAYEDLAEFVSAVAAAGCRTFIVHARKAWLEGLSPKQNREVPPLRYDVVFRLKRDFPGLNIEINGGVTSLDQAEMLLAETTGVRLDGVMIGREAYSNPWILADVDRRFYGEPEVSRSRLDILEAYLPYVAAERAAGVRLAPLVKPILGLFQGQPGARRWRRGLSESVPPDAGAEFVRACAAHVRSAGTSRPGASRSPIERDEGRERDRDRVCGRATRTG